MLRENKSARPETVAIHAGRDVDPASGAVVPPIHVSTTFERASAGTYPHGHSYSRESSPNRSSLERCIASPEGRATAVALASGSAAVLAVCDAIGPGGHLIATYDSYHGTLKQLDEVVQRGGLEVTLVDTTDIDAVTNQLQLIFRATSLGGVESLIEHRASIEGPNTRAPDNLLRLSVGLEHADDLIADLDQALTSG